MSVGNTHIIWSRLPVTKLIKRCWISHRVFTILLNFSLSAHTLCPHCVWDNIRQRNCPLPQSSLTWLAEQPRSLMQICCGNGLNRILHNYIPAGIQPNNSVFPCHPCCTPHVHITTLYLSFMLEFLMLSSFSKRLQSWIHFLSLIKAVANKT